VLPCLEPIPNTIQYCRKELAQGSVAGWRRRVGDVECAYDLITVVQFSKTKAIRLWRRQNW
jgi:hypothetical protein